MTIRRPDLPRVGARSALVAFATLVLVVTNSPAQTRAPSQAPATGVPAAQPSAQQQAPSSSAPNPVTAAMMKSGVKRCAQQIQNVTDFLARNSKVGWVPFPAARNADDSLISLSSEIQTAGVLGYANVDFAPRAEGGCSAVYEQVTHWSNTCDQVHAAHYPTFQPKGALLQQIRVYYNNPQSQVMLIPAGTGCVVVKKEILH